MRPASARDPHGMTLWKACQRQGNRGMGVKRVRHVEGNEQPELGSLSRAVCVRNSCHLPIIIPDVEGKPIDTMSQRQVDISDDKLARKVTADATVPFFQSSSW